MELFKKQTVKEQIDLESLKVDAAKISAMKKVLTATKTAHSKMMDRYGELQKQVEEISAREVAQLEGKGIEAALVEISSFLSFKNSYNLEDIGEELVLLMEWWGPFATEKLDKVKGDLFPLIHLQQEKLQAIEKEFETESNTAEIDEIAVILSAEYADVVTQFKEIGQIKNLVTDKDTYPVPVGLWEVSRNSLTQKAASHAAKEVGDWQHAVRAQIAINDRQEARGLEGHPLPGLDIL